MKIELKEEATIRGKDHEAGEVVVIRKDDGERLIEAGLANRVIEETENRIRGLPARRKFSNHTVFGR